MRKENISFVFAVFLRTIFQEGFSEPANFWYFTHFPPVVTARELVTGTALWEFGLAFRFCVVLLAVCGCWTALCVVVCLYGGLVEVYKIKCR